MTRMEDCIASWPRIFKKCLSKESSLRYFFFHVQIFFSSIFRQSIEISEDKRTRHTLKSRRAYKKKKKKNTNRVWPYIDLFHSRSFLFEEYYWKTRVDSPALRTGCNGVVVGVNTR